MRCNWEARKYPYNWVVTLTYKDEFLTFTKKGNATLVKDEYQRFLKRLRKACPDSKLRYLIRGEYGGQFGRPHYHMILFGMRAYSVEEVGFRISDVWPYGGVFVDTYSDRAVNYVTSYLLKADDLSQYKDDDIVRPFIAVSQRPMIGSNFLDSATGKRCLETNDYSYLSDNDAVVPVPRRMQEKLDDMVCTDDFQGYFDRVVRKDQRRVYVNSEEVVHYSDDYLMRKQVDRAAAVQLKKTKEYFNNKCKS